MKEEGFKKDYFDNFVKYKNSDIINGFNKNLFNKDYISYYFDAFFQNYKSLGNNKILTFNAPTESNYNKDLIKKYLNNFNHEKTFFALNTISNITSVKTFLNSVTTTKLNYYNVDFIIGEYPEDFKNNITDETIKYDKLKFREINPYFSEINKNKVNPCYKEKTNKCKDLNEFDYNNENEYKGTILEDQNKNYLTYYQIDKSSESYIVNSYLEIQFEENDLLSEDIYNYLEDFYISFKISELNELHNIYMYNLDTQSISFRIQSFTDNTERIIKDLINNIMEEPKENEFNYSIISLKSWYIKSESISFRDYVYKIAQQFMNKGKNDDLNITQLFEEIDNFTFDDFKNIHNHIINNIKLIKFKIAGNINIQLVETIHNYIKGNLKISSQLNNIKNFKLKLESNNTFIYNYYQKSTMSNEVDNGIVVIYEYDEEYEPYMDILHGCLDNIAMINLRFNYSNAYHQEN